MTPVRRLRLYSEFVSYAVYPRREVLDASRRFSSLCAERGTTLQYVLQVFVTPGAIAVDTDVAALAAAVTALRGAGVDVALWPQLSDRSRVFLNVRTADDYTAGVVALYEVLTSRLAAPLPDILYDLEPEKRVLADLFALRPRAIGGLLALDVAARRDRYALERVRVETADRYGVGAFAAVFPQVSDRRWGGAAQRVLGTPFAGHDGRPAFVQLSSMAYGSFIEGMGWKPELREKKSRARARVVERWARQHRATYGAAAAVILGMTATGILGDEPLYATVSDFLDDLRAVKALGYSDIGIYSISGLLFRATGRDEPRRERGAPFATDRQVFTPRHSEFVHGEWGWMDLVEALV